MPIDMIDLALAALALKMTALGLLLQWTRIEA